MKKRSPLAVFFLGLITLGFYSWYWEVKTKGEMNNLGEHIPTAWLWLIPFVGYIWWAWKYSEGVGHVTKDEAPAILIFLLMMFTGVIGDAIIQYYFNEAGAVPATVPVDPTVPVTETPALDTPAAPSPEAPATPVAPEVEVPPTTPEIPPAAPTPAPETPPSTDNNQPPTPPNPTVMG